MRQNPTEPVVIHPVPQEPFSPEPILLNLKPSKLLRSPVPLKRLLFVTLLFVGYLLALGGPIAGEPMTSKDSALTKAPEAQMLGDGPRLGFIANRGQLPQDVAFHLPGKEQHLWVRSGELILRRHPVADGDPDVGDVEPRSATVRVRYLGARSEATPSGLDPWPGRVQFYRGADPESWVAGAPTFGTVVQDELYAGIAHVMRIEAGGVKSEYVVAPGADPSRIRMRYDGANGLFHETDGSLRIQTGAGDWRESAPVAYQDIDGRRRPVEARFESRGSLEIGFQLGAYDADHELVIDPLLYFSTFLGGSATESGAGLDIDPSGNVLVTGTTLSSDLTAITPAVFTAAFATFGGDRDGFVAKIDPGSSTLLYLTYLGGSNRELFGYIEADPTSTGHVVVAGWTNSFDFPTTAGSYGPTPFGVSGGGTVDDVAVVRLDSTGMLLASTYVGGSSDDQVEDLALGPDGSVFVTGGTASTNYPVTSMAYQGTRSGSWDAFVTRLTPDLDNLVCSTFFGDTQFDYSYGVDVDPTGHIYFGGRTDSVNFPTTAGAYDTTCAVPMTTWHAKLDPMCENLVYSTCMDETLANHLDVEADALGRAYVLLDTDSPSFPATPGAYDTTYNGARDMALMRFNAAGSGLDYATFIGDSQDDFSRDLFIDGSFGAYFIGYTGSPGFATVDPIGATGAAWSGANDALVGRLLPDGSGVDLLSYWGGIASESGLAIAADPAGRVCFSGGTGSFDLPLESPVQPWLLGSADAYVACTIDDPPCEDPPGGLVAWWPFDEPAGPVAAELVFGNDGTHAGGPVAVPGMVDGALLFDGVDDHVEAAYDPVLEPGLGDFSVDFWLKTDSDMQHGIVDTLGVNPGAGYTIFLRQGLLGIRMADTSLGSLTYVGAPFPLDDEWHFVAVTVDRDDPAGGIFYVDGAPVAVFDPTPVINNMVDFSNYRIGAFLNDAWPLKGALDELEVFNLVLSPDTVEALYEAGSAGKCKPTGTDPDLYPDPWVDDTPYTIATVPGPDTGVEPNTMPQPAWQSRSIWVRADNTPTTSYTTHQNPEFGQQNLVHVEVCNRSAVPAVNVGIEVWWANASTGLDWFADFNLIPPVAAIPVLPPYSCDIVRTPWFPPAPSPGSHFCLSARVISPEDPTLGLTANVNTNTRNKNNLSWRNVNIVDLVTSPVGWVDFTVRNIESIAANLDLIIGEQDGLLQEGVELVLDLGDLYAVWTAGGSQGANVQDAGGTSVRLLGFPARLENLAMASREAHLITLNAVAPQPADRPGQTYDFFVDFTQYVDVEGEGSQEVGGVSNVLRLRGADFDTDGDGDPDITDPDDDGDGINDDEDEDPLGVERADLSLTKDNGLTTVMPRQALSYTLTVHNAGPSTLSSIKVIDTLPPGLTGVSFVPSGGSYDPATGSWMGLTLGPGDTVTLTVNATVTEDAADTLTNTACVSPPDGTRDDNRDNDCDGDTDRVAPHVDLSLTKVDAVTEVLQGQNLGYVITVRNSGPATVSSLSVIDNAPPELMNLQFSPSVGNYDATTGLWTGLALAPGGAVQLFVGADLADGALGEVTNTACVFPPQGLMDDDPDNNCDSDTNAIVGALADLSVTKENGQDTVLPGQALTYTITVSNAGPSTLSTIYVVDTLPPELFGAVFSPNTGIYDPTTGAWTGLNLGAGQSITLTLEATAVKCFRGPLINNVTVRPPDGVFDLNPDDNSAQDSDPVDTSIFLFCDGFESGDTSSWSAS